MGHKTRIMYIEYKGDSIVGAARIGRVTYSKTGKSIYYQGREFGSLNGTGFKANYFDVETREEYWISGCKKDGTDALYSTTVEIDDDVREEYWTKIRNKPESKNIKSFKCVGKYAK
ncbi:MAG TPA: 1-deoxy-D-xylulose-5-phosphate synthase [Blastocatellia bacterium]|nr:1-deoxy-D-xylulose-5-phosphate synthase [Blastocatellia bacterium]